MSMHVGSSHFGISGRCVIRRPGAIGWASLFGNSGQHGICVSGGNRAIMIAGLPTQAEIKIIAKTVLCLAPGYNNS